VALVIGWLSSIAARLRCAWCGHDDLRALDRQARRLAMECGDCGRRTRGWDLGTLPPPTLRFTANHWRLRMPRTAAVYRGRQVVHALVTQGSRRI
jgi:hypothetical protein